MAKTYPRETLAHFLDLVVPALVSSEAGVAVDESVAAFPAAAPLGSTVGRAPLLERTNSLAEA